MNKKSLVVLVLTLATLFAGNLSAAEYFYAPNNPPSVGSVFGATGRVVAISDFRDMDGFLINQAAILLVNGVPHAISCGAGADLYGQSNVLVSSEGGCHLSLTDGCSEVSTFVGVVTGTPDGGETLVDIGTLTQRSCRNSAGACVKAGGNYAQTSLAIEDPRLLPLADRVYVRSASTCSTNTVSYP